MVKRNEKVSNKIKLEQLVFDIIQELPERSKNVIIKRYNLNDKGVSTLDKIGKDYGITRERVRQIETEAKVKLKTIGEKHDINLAFEQIKDIIERNGGLISEEKLINLLFTEESDRKINKQISLLILSLNDKIKTVKETKIFKKIYFYEKESIDKFKNAIGILEKHLLENKTNLNFEKITDLLKEKGLSNLTKESVKSYLESNKIVLGNIIDEWGLEKWSHINPKSVRDKAYLTLKKNKKPLHFVQITNKINEIWSDSKKRANNQTVHNELIKDDRFVLVGRGIYALKEWGYKPGTVLDVLLEIFNENKIDMNQDEIIEKVLKKRKVKNNTIILNLQNKKYFEKLPNKIYRLKQA
ncbi:MAG: sigma factor-like helix-turn-helix DNA-binding protein [Patescibacteria group bacterium]|nr:sigma factor-like helix-turn-helix DNA-binding protein [Patescibacteria group bacterium]